MLRLLRNDSPRVPEITHFDVRHAGETYCIKLKRSAAARRFILRVRAAARDVVLTIPARASLNDARSFADRHAPWVGAKLRRLPEKTRFSPGEQVPVRGILHRIEHRPGQRGTVWIEPSADIPASGGGPSLCVNAEICFVSRRVHDFLIREARRDLGAAAARHAASLGVRIGKITLRDTTSRWGSCSSTGGLSFSWRLVMAPPFVLDYLAAHEVAHLLHMNHSPAFWRVVAKLSNDVRPAEAWLKAHGTGLLRFGPGPD
jgi:predicted metal-dependent hydrolase